MSNKNLSKKNLLFVLGTRPEAIKLAPIIEEFKTRNGLFRPVVCSSGQHAEMLSPVLDFFGIQVDHELKVMRPGATLSSLFASCLERLDDLLARTPVDLMAVQGDTTTAFAGALAAYHRKVPVAHVEAGLRSHDRYAPFPEEINRRLIDHVATWHFAPTLAARDNLREEGIRTNLYSVGNSVVDAMNMASRKLCASRPEDALSLAGVDFSKKILLLTCHRRENIEQDVREIFQGIREVVDRVPGVQLVFPLHLNPAVRGPARECLSGSPRVLLLEHLEYPDFLALMSRAYLVLTDSGGVQEEAPSFGVPVLVLRNVTERREGVEAGIARLVGTRRESVGRGLSSVLESEEERRGMVASANPYGDGRTSARIFDILKRDFG